MLTEEQNKRLKAVREKEREENKERIKAAKVELMKNLIIISKDERPKGGQSCGMPILPISVKSEELGVEIIVKSFRSNFQNRDLAVLLMELAMDDLIK